MIKTAQLDQIKANVDIVQLASEHTTLRKLAAREFAGPCPKCEGRDRFHVHADGWWFCRNCHEGRGDAIELVKFVTGCDFTAACERLGARPAMQKHVHTTEAKREAWRTAEWQTKAMAIVNNAIEALNLPLGAAASAYLTQRSIDWQTWQAWQLGYDVDKRALVIPWFAESGEITAIKYRRIDNKADMRYWSEEGSTALLYGLHMIDRSARTLVIIEGELNAISVWQACRAMGISVVSIGSQKPSAAARAEVARVARDFQQVVVWCDEAERAQALLSAVGNRALPLQSPNGWDANDLLKKLQLDRFMQRVLGRASEKTLTRADVAALLRRAIAATPSGYFVDVPCDFDEETPQAELQCIARQLEATIQMFTGQHA